MPQGGGSVIVDEIPMELRERAQWVAWANTDRDDNPTKIPINPHTGRYAGVDDPATWGAIQRALARCAAAHLAGIGFVFTPDDPYVGIDLDDCRNRETGELSALADAITQMCPTYTEVSPSGTGIKLFMRGTIPRNRKSGGIEVYNEGRFFTVTGQRLPGAPTTVNDCQAGLDWLFREQGWDEEQPPAEGSGRRSGRRGRQRSEPVPERIADGDRNVQLTRLAGRSRRDGDSEDAIFARIWQANLDRCAPPLKEAEVRRIAQSIAGYEAPTERSLTELEDAREFARRQGDDLLSVHAERRDYVFDGRVWVEDNTQEFVRRVKHVVRMRHAEAEAEPDPERRRSLLRYFRSAESARKIRAVGDLARSEPTIAASPDVFADKPWLLNVANGTLNLQSGILQDHSRGDYLRQILDVPYDPDAEAPRWGAFLREIFAGDQAVIDYLQRAIGYALTGITRNERLFVLWGAGANGKSTLIETLLAVLGPYAIMAERDLLLNRKWESHPTGLADLEGRRLAVTVETDRGRRLNEALTKQLTGGDTIRARRMRENFHEFKPTHKLFLVTNHRPEVQGQGEAIWRRVVLVPFTVTFPPEQRDALLREKLLAEAPGILAWAVRGCLEWQRMGLAEPEAVLAATADYRVEQDTLAAWLEEKCQVGDASLRESPSALHSSYATWCKDHGINPPSGPDFGAMLTERGFGTAKSHGKRMRTGLLLSGQRRIVMGQ